MSLPRIPLARRHHSSSLLARGTVCLLLTFGCASALGADPTNPLAAPAKPTTAPADTWAGDYEGNGLRVSLRAQNTGYVGSLTFQGKTYPAAASVKGKALSGRFRAGTDSYPFVLRIRKDAYELESGGRAYTLQKAPSAATSYKKYRHAIGFEMRYPSAWRLREGGGGLLLVPPDTPAGQQEVYYIGSEAATGIAKVTDPRVAQFLDDQMARAFPHLKRTTPPKAIRCLAGTGLLLTYTGKSPDTSEDVLLLVHVTLLKGRGVYLAGAGPAKLLRRRRQTLRQVFSSFGVGAAVLDERLVGRWWHYRSSGSGKASSSYEEWLTLRADGTCLLRNESLISVRTHNPGEYRDGPSAEMSGVGQEKGLPGIWSAENGVLTILYADGSGTTGRYNALQGGWQLVLTNGRKVLYGRAK